MDDRSRDGRDEGGGRGGDRRDRGGPPETQWLHLEMSKVIQSEAEGLAREAIVDILKDSIKTRLLERLGPRLEAVGRAVADQIADDIEANLDIEARIDARRQARRTLDARIAEALRGHRGEEPPRDPSAG